MGCGGSKTTTVKNEPNPVFMGAYTNLLNQANQVAATPYSQYSGQVVAGMNPTQTGAIDAISGLQGGSQQYLDQAKGLLDKSTADIWGNSTQFSPDEIQKYMSPYTQSVIDATQAQFNNQNAQQFNQARGATAAAGAFGGDRQAVLEAQLGNQQQLAQAPVIAGLRNQGYSQALGEFNTQQQAELQAREAQAALAGQGATGAMNLANLSQTLPLNQALAQLQAGTLQQQQKQSELNVPYEQWLQQQAFPYQNLNWLAGITEGIGSQTGGTQQTTQPKPSLFSQIAGLGMAAAPFFLRDGGAVGGDNVVPFRRARGGMMPYNRISVSSDVPDLSQGYIDVGGVPGARGNTMPSGGGGGQADNDNDLLGMGAKVGAMGLAKSGFFGNRDLAPTAYDAVQLSGGLTLPAGTISGAKVGGGGGFGNGDFWGAFGRAKGGMVKRDMGGLMPVPVPTPRPDLPTDPDPEPPTHVFSTPINRHALEATNYGLTPPTPIQRKAAAKPDWREALFTAGLATLAGRSPNALENIGRGGLQGLQEYAGQRATNEDLADKQYQQDVENQKTTLTYNEALNRARQLADDMDYRRNQSEKQDTQFEANEAQQNRFHQDQLAQQKSQNLFEQQRIAIDRIQANNAAAGTWQYAGVDPDGLPILINNRTGQQKTGEAAIGAKPGAGGAGGGRYAAQVTRSLTSAIDAAADLENISRLPVATNSGMWGNRRADGEGSLMHSTWNVLGNQLTPDASKKLNASFVGIGRALAGLETGGTASAGGVALMQQYEKLAPQVGDSAAIAMYKLATLRQNALNGIEANKASPYIGKEQLTKFEEAEKRLKKAIPYTPMDVNNFELEAQKNPRITFADYAKEHGLGGLPGDTAPQEGTTVRQGGHVFKVINGKYVDQGPG